MNAFHIAVAALAAWRLAHMIAWEAGPFWIFVRFRKAIGIEHDGEEPVSWKPVHEVLMCNLCSTVWFGTLFFLLYFVVPMAVTAVSVWGVAALFVKVSSWLDQEKS